MREPFSRITCTDAAGYSEGDSITISGVNKRDIKLDSGNIIKDALPFLFRFDYVPVEFSVISAGSTEMFIGES